MGRYMVATDLITILGLPAGTSTIVLDFFIDAAESAIDRETGRRFDSVTETRRFDVADPGEYLSVGDLVSVTAVGVADETGGAYTALAASDYFLGPSVRPAGHPYHWIELSNVGSYGFAFGFRTVEITGTWGWAAVPADIKALVASMVARTYHQSRGGGVQRITDIPGLGTVEFADTADTASGGFTASEARQLSRYRRMVFA